MPQTEGPQGARRKGATRMSEIPPGVLDGLNRGRLQTITLVEWLAIDQRRLLRAVLPDLGLDGEAARSLRLAADRLAAEGITARTRGTGRALHEATRRHARRSAIAAALSAHPADMVRSWAAYMIAADETLTLEQRLEAARPFAADPHMAVREAAWDSFRPWLAADLHRGLRRLRRWVRDPHPGIRRCAIEATRPRGVWCAHIEQLKKDPEPGRVLLESVRSDPSLYVRRSAANWLNDASKTRPDWVRAVCADWTRSSKTPETAWIVGRALRTLRREASPDRDGAARS